MRKALYFICLSVLLPSILYSHPEINELPNIALTLRTKVEQNLSKSDLLFYVRNARFALRGKLNDLFSYKVEMDWQDEDEITMLDAFISFKPFNNFSITLGQQKQPFSNEYKKTIRLRYCK